MEQSQREPNGQERKNNSKEVVLQEREHPLPLPDLAESYVVAFLSPHPALSVDFLFALCSFLSLWARTRQDVCALFLPTEGGHKVLTLR